MKHEIEWFHPNNDTYMHMRDYAGDYSHRALTSLALAGVGIITGLGLDFLFMALTGGVWASAGPVLTLIMPVLLFVLGWVVLPVMQKTHRFYNLKGTALDAVKAYDRLPQSAKNELPAHFEDEVRRLSENYDDRVELEKLVRRMEDITNSHEKMVRAESRNPAALEVIRDGLTRVELDIKARRETLAELEAMD